MGLLTIIRKTRLKERQVRVLMLGLDNAGKTTIVKHILGEDTSEVSPTLGFNIRTIVHQGFSLNVWDIGGQTSLRPYWRNYFESTDAVIWVVDSSDRERMEDCRRELRELLQEERLAGASLLVFANKQDLAGVMTCGEIAEALQLSLLTSHTSTIKACSARSITTLEGDRRIWAGLDWVVAEVSQRVYYGTGGGALGSTSRPNKSMDQETIASSATASQ